MILGIGCDVVNHNITQGLGWSSNPHHMRRIFSAKEFELFQFNKTDRFISGRFAAKEAVLKCLGTGMMDGISLTDIQVLQTDLGKPVLEIDGGVKKIALRLGITTWHISISHTVNSSIAFVIAESKS
jgi:holo-[acyl-carrier protein] synthase